MPCNAGEWFGVSRFGNAKETSKRGEMPPNATAIDSVAKLHGQKLSNVLAIDFSNRPLKPFHQLADVSDVIVNRVAAESTFALQVGNVAPDQFFVARGIGELR